VRRVEHADGLPLAQFPPGDSVAEPFPGPAGNIPAGEFRGRVAAYGSAAELPISGRAERTRAGLRIRGRVRYADLPEDWGSRVRPDGLDFRLRGAVGNVPVDWIARLSWGAEDLRTLDWTLGFERDVSLTNLAVLLPLAALVGVGVAELLSRRRGRLTDLPWRVAAWSVPIVAVPLVAFTVAVLGADAAKASESA